MRELHRQYESSHSRGRLRSSYFAGCQRNSCSLPHEHHTSCCYTRRASLRGQCECLYSKGRFKVNIPLVVGPANGHAPAQQGGAPYVYIYIHIYIYYTHTHTCVCVCVCNICIYVYTYIFVSLYMYISRAIYLSMYFYLRSIYLSIHPSIHLSYMYIYIHTHIYIYIYYKSCAARLPSRVSSTLL